jgi:hypothetical protein
MLVSVPEKVNEILVVSVSEPSVNVLLLPSVAESINVSGGTVSTVHVKEDGDESLLPELSIDITSNIWAPSERLLNWAGLVHVENEEPSNEHSKLLISVVGTPPTETDNTKVIELDCVRPSLVTDLPAPSTEEIISVSGPCPAAGTCVV